MKFLTGKNPDGSIPRLSDGLPAFAVSECGRYTVSRVILGRGVHYEAWFENESKPNDPTHLCGSFDKAEAIDACEAHANSTRPRIAAA